MPKPLVNDVLGYAKSSSFKMALLFTLLCGFSLIVLGYFVNFFEYGHFVHSTEDIIDTEIRHLPATLDQTSMVGQHAQAGRLFIPFGDDGKTPDILSGDIDRLKEGMIVFEHPQIQQTYAAKIHTFKDNQKILVATDITEIQRDFKVMRWLSVASIALIILVVVVSYLISVFVARGTHKIAKTAQNIMETGDLSKRLEVRSEWDDLSQMSHTLNLMLDRIELLMNGLRQMSDNIAHDLRTPLTRLRNHIEATKSNDVDAKNNALLKEADGLLNTFNALLRISRIETEKRRTHFKVIPLKPLIEDVIAFYEPLAEQKEITIESTLVDIDFNGDKDLLFQAYTNILDNAIKYTPMGGLIKVLMQADNQQYAVTIEDTGQGIPEAELDKVFQRFYRTDVSRSSAGTGLGLSLVKAVFDLHHITVLIENTQQGIRFITKW